MKNVFLAILFVFAFCDVGAAKDKSKGIKKPIYVSAVALPADVEAAVRTNYEIGRDTWDSHSLVDLLVYNVHNKGASTVQTLERVLKLLADQGGLSFDGVCKDLKAKNKLECAKQLLLNNRTEGELAETLDGWIVDANIMASSGSFDYENEGKQFAESTQTILSYIESLIGKNYTEITATTEEGVADVVTTIFISPNKKKVVIVSTAVGA